MVTMEHRVRQTGRTLGLWFECNIEWFNPGMVYLLIFLAAVIFAIVRK